MGGHSRRIGTEFRRQRDGWFARTLFSVFQLTVFVLEQGRPDAEEMRQRLAAKQQYGNHAPHGPVGQVRPAFTCRRTPPCALVSDVISAGARDPSLGCPD